MGKKDNIVINLFDFDADLLATLHASLDGFAGVPLQDTEYGRVRLQAGFILREGAGTGHGDDDSKNKCVAFHNQLVLRYFWSIGQQIIHGSRSGGLEYALRIMRELRLSERQRARPGNCRPFDF